MRERRTSVFRITSGPSEVGFCSVMVSVAPDRHPPDPQVGTPSLGRTINQRIKSPAKMSMDTRSDIVSPNAGCIR